MTIFVNADLEGGGGPQQFSFRSQREQLPKAFKILPPHKAAAPDAFFPISFRFVSLIRHLKRPLEMFVHGRQSPQPDAARSQRQQRGVASASGPRRSAVLKKYPIRKFELFFQTSAAFKTRPRVHVGRSRGRARQCARGAKEPTPPPTPPPPIVQLL